MGHYFFRRGFLLVILGLGGAILSAPEARAGVFNLPHFVEPGKFAIGLEPELTLTNGAGLAGNLKYTHGLTDLSNVTAIIGTGGGPRRFRAGANMSFDFFPDLEKQPGIGIAVQGVYYRFPVSGRFEVTGIPYIHKAFLSPGGEFEPFFALPFGMGFSDGQYKILSTAVVGSMFKRSENFRFSMEVGVAINNTDGYFSGGVVYYY